VRRCANCRLEQCAEVNPAAAATCAACSAALWDGEDGQLRARVAAILQARTHLITLQAHFFTLIDTLDHAASRSSQCLFCAA